MRLFVGIPLADAVERALAGITARLRSKQSLRGRASTELRWTEPDSWHITLQFLGNSTPAQFDLLKAGLAHVRSIPAPVQLGQLGFFDRSGVLFADVVITPELAALQQNVAAATSRCGFIAEPRPFHPHITLARTTGNKRPRNWENKGPQADRREGVRRHENILRVLAARGGSAPPLPRFVAREFVLYESHLGQEGSKYEIRQRFPLVAP